MRRPLVASFALCVLCASAGTQSVPGEQLEAERLQERLQQARSRLAEARRELAELVHLRVAHDLRVPVDVRGVLPEPSAALASTPEEKRRLLRESAQRAEQLAMRLRELQAKGFLVPMDPIAVPAKPARIDRQPAAETPTPGKGSPEAIVSLARVPRARNDQSGDLRIPSPLLLRNRVVITAPRFQLEPAFTKTKVIAALLQAGRQREALLLLDEVLQQSPDSHVHLFLKAKALEKLGRTTDAITVFESLVTLDTVVDSNDRPLPGPWARSAALAIKHLGWMQRFGGWQPPGLEELDW